jgi:predicted nucleic acid-binding protein
MSASFIDSNILVYLTQGDLKKAEKSEELLRAGGFTSVQVLNEIANVARKKYDKPWSEIRAFLRLVGRLLEVTPLTMEIHEQGLRLAERYRLSVYDGMILSAALATGSAIVWSEDMQHGMVIEDSLRIRNPFIDSH